MKVDLKKLQPKPEPDPAFVQKSEQQFIRAGQSVVKEAAERKPEERPFLSKLKFWQKKQTFVRRHSRHDCCIVAEMHIIDRDISLQGVLLEISLGGVLFRVASGYLLDRAGQNVTIRFEKLEMQGRIMSTRPQGYGIKLFSNFDPEVFEDLVELYGFVR
jgi:hypothetical protein